MLLTSSNPTQHVVPWCPACGAFSAQRLQPRFRVRSAAQQQRSDAGTAADASGEQAVAVASPFSPTRVRVQHDTYIRASRAAMWSLMQDVTPSRKWQQVAVVLATLESIYGVEYQGLAEQLLTAFQQANRAPASPSTAPATAGSSRSASRLDVDQRFDFSGQRGCDQFDHLGPSLLLSLPDAARQHSNGSSVICGSANGSVNGFAASSMSGSRSGSSSMDGSPSSSRSDGKLHTRKQAPEQHNQQSQQQMPVSSNSSSSTAGQHATSQACALSDAAATAEDAEQSAAAAADAAFMQLLLLSAKRAAFVPLSERDVALGVSLNTDFLWQLFVKVSTEQLDSTLVAPQLLAASAGAAGAGGSATAGAAGPAGPPKETDSLLVLRRGYSSEQQRGRWLLQKLDYLQLLLVKRAISGLTRLGGHVLQQARSMNQTMKSQQQQQQQSKVQRRLQRQLSSANSGKGKGKVPPVTTQQQPAGSAAASSIKQLRRQSGNSKPRTDGFGRPYPETDSMQQGRDEANTSSSSSSSVRPGMGSTVGFDIRDGLSSSSNGSNSSDADGGTTISDSSSSSSIVTDKRSAHGEGQQQQQQQQQQQPKKKRRGLLGQVSARAEQSFRNVLLTLSDWGVIPRMDVTPLEVFDEVYPLIEPPRFQPLFIEKATLPDIMDPVIEPHLSWLGRTRSHNPGSGSSRGSSEGVSAATGSTDGSSSISSWESAAASIDGRTGSSSSSSSGGLLQTLLEPVEIVEPTFRQMLVVYRKKPKPERWREAWFQLTGQKVAAVARRSTIQLQVYRDIPLPSWQVVFPDKLLQFRPLDLLRLDLFGLAGATAVLAQAKYSSLILELVTLVSLSVWGTRMVLGYMRMGDRYKSIVAQLLAERTVAGGEGGLEYLATAAGLQQFKQAALVYVLLAAADRPLDADQVAAAAEAVLQQQLRLQVCFNADEALAELRRFGLLVEQQQQQGSAAGVCEQQQQQQQQVLGQQEGLDQGVAEAAAVAAAAGGMRRPAASASASVAAAALGASEQAPSAAATAVAVAEQSQSVAAQTTVEQQQQVVYRVLDSREAQQVLQQYWAGLLRQRVRSILRAV